MASNTLHLYVRYHFETGGKKSSPEYNDHVLVTSADYNSIRSVLSSNGRLLGAGTLVIDGYTNESGTNILS